MSGYTQDTWILNVATNSAQNPDKFVHYCRIELPAKLSQSEAEIRSAAISNMMTGGCKAPDAKWHFTLTRWELRGREINVSK